MASSSVAEKMYSGSTVPVRFITSTYDRKMPNTVFHVPVKVTLDGLSDFVNATMKITPPVSFNFLYNDNFIVFNVLDKWMKSCKISKEEPLDLEYTPAFEIESGPNMPHDDWVATICKLPLETQEGNSNSSSSSSSSINHSGYTSSNIIQDIAAATAATKLMPYITGSYDRCLRLWKGQECLFVGGVHDNAVKKVIVLSASEGEVGKGKRKRDAYTFTLLSCSNDGTVRLWKFENGNMTEGYRLNHTEAIETIAVSADSSLVCSGGWDKTLRIYNLEKLLEDFESGKHKRESKYLTASLAGHSRAILTSAFSKTHQSHVMSAGYDGVLRIGDVEQNSSVMNFAADAGACYCMDNKEATGGDFVLTGHTDTKIRLWDTRSSRCAQTYAGHTGWIFDVNWNSENQFSSGSEDATVAIWDSRSTTPLGKLNHHTDGVLSLCWLGSRSLLSGSKDTSVRHCTISSMGFGRRQLL